MPSPSDPAMNVTREAETQRRRAHFEALRLDEQVQAIRRLALSGHGGHTIARATGLSVEQVRCILRGSQA